jgi:hypothetical protein
MTADRDLDVERQIAGLRVIMIPSSLVELAGFASWEYLRVCPWLPLLALR